MADAEVDRAPLIEPARRASGNARGGKGAGGKREQGAQQSRLYAALVLPSSLAIHRASMVLIVPSSHILPSPPSPPPHPSALPSRICQFTNPSSVSSPASPMIRLRPVARPLDHELDGISSSARLMPSRTSRLYRWALDDCHIRAYPTSYSIRQ
ncbi:hypothetical protein C8R44DRAFT_870492 [Mycena epipterygia]|nr:hypothetical protein C8R44DRAFT_870492 [Mycena epipterygia]